MAQYGIKIGTVMSNFYFTGGIPSPYKDYDVDLRPYLGYDAGLAQLNEQKPLFAPYVSVYRRFRLSNRVGFQPELSFSQKGVNFSHSDYEKITYKVKINYLEIPLSFSYQFVQKEKIVSELYLGGYGAFRLNAYKKVGTHNGAVEKVEINSVNNFDGGMHLGVNAKYRIRNHLLLLDMRFFVGLTDIFTTPESWTDIYLETHNASITGFNLSIGYEL